MKTLDLDPLDLKSSFKSNPYIYIMLLYDFTTFKQ